MVIAPFDAWLERIVEAEENWGRSGGDRDSFRLVHLGGMQRSIEHPGWDRSWATPTKHDVDDLLDADLVRLDTQASGDDRTFSLTERGRRRGQRARNARRSSPTARSLEWDAIAPALDAAITAYEQIGATPDQGVHVGQIPLPDGTPRSVLAELVSAKLLVDVEAEGGGVGGFDQGDGPSLVRPSTEALRLRRGWPAGPADVAIDRLIQALLAQADSTADPDERTRLRKMADWLGKFGTDVLTNVASQQASQQAGGLF